MALVVHGKMEIDVWIKSPAEKFHDMFSGIPHHFSNMSPAKVQGCKLHQGDWAAVGSVLSWDYVHGTGYPTHLASSSVDIHVRLRNFNLI